MVVRVSLVALSVALLLCSFVPRYEAKEVRCSDNITYNDEPPFDWLPLPVCGENLRISMTLYTRADTQTGKPVTRNSLPPTFDGNLTTLFIVHGYLGCTTDQPWMAACKDNILSVGNYNVILVSWPLGSISPNYFQSASDTRSVGTEIGLVVENMIDFGGSAKERVTCVGHSLGSHICGHAGARTKLGRIIGLDPAGPLFQDRNWTCGLNPSCADRVDAIHTGARGSHVLNCGTMKPLGHVDFYPNGAGPQPQCGVKEELEDFFNPFQINFRAVQNITKQISGVAKAFVTFTEALPTVCNHMAAVFYFQQSILSNCFLSTQHCTDQNHVPGSCVSTLPEVQPMGFTVDNGQDGIYYLTTYDDPSYCQASGSGSGISSNFTIFAALILFALLWNLFQ